MAKDSAAELGRSFHQEGTFTLKFCESDFVPLWDGIKGCRASGGFVGTVNIDALNFMRAAIGSQCKLIKRGVTCILFGSLKINLAVAFWINCKGLIELAGRPAKRALQ